MFIASETAAVQLMWFVGINKETKKYEVFLGTYNLSMGEKNKFSSITEPFSCHEAANNYAEARKLGINLSEKAAEGIAARYNNIAKKAPPK